MTNKKFTVRFQSSFHQVMSQGVQDGDGDVPFRSLQLLPFSIIFITEHLNFLYELGAGDSWLILLELGVP